MAPYRFQLSFNTQCMAEYPINKGIGRPVEFKGLKAQYLFIFCGGLLALFVLLPARPFPCANAEAVAAIMSAAEMMNFCLMFLFINCSSDTSKTAASWFGACIFLIVAATILRSFFL